MTNEEIIEEAKSYSTFIGSQGKSSFGELYDAYIAGAHSRDEEIEDLSIAATGLAKENKELKIKLAELRNPWISVEDRLPKVGFVLVYIPMRNIEEVPILAQFRGAECYFFGLAKVNVHDVGITHWMPIPELPKKED